MAFKGDKKGQSNSSRKMSINNNHNNNQEIIRQSKGISKNKNKYQKTKQFQAIMDESDDSPNIPIT